MTDETTPAPAGPPRSTKLASSRTVLEARAAGRAAGRVGRPRSECPYSPTGAEAEARAWIAGFQEGREARREEGTPLPQRRRAKQARKA